MKLKDKAWAGLAALLLLAVACGTPLPGGERRWREGRQQAISSALAEAGKPAITLAYFPYDPVYRFRTIVEPVTPPAPVRIPTSAGTVRDAHRVGRVRLRMPSGEATLALYALDDLQATCRAASWRSTSTAPTTPTAPTASPPSAPSHRTRTPSRSPSRRASASRRRTERVVAAIVWAHLMVLSRIHVRG